MIVYITIGTVMFAEWEGTKKRICYVTLKCVWHWSFLCTWKAGTMLTRFTSVSHHWPKSDLETLFLDKGKTNINCLILSSSIIEKKLAFNWEFLAFNIDQQPKTSSYSITKMIPPKKSSGMVVQLQWRWFLLVLALAKRSSWLSPLSTYSWAWPLWQCVTTFSRRKWA